MFSNSYHILKVVPQSYQSLGIIGGINNFICNVNNSLIFKWKEIKRQIEISSKLQWLFRKILKFNDSWNKAEWHHSQNRWVISINCWFIVLKCIIFSQRLKAKIRSYYLVLNKMNTPLIKSQWFWKQNKTAKAKSYPSKAF